MSGRRNRDGDGGEDLAGLERGEIGALVEIGGRHVAGAVRSFQTIAGAERHHHGRHVVARIAIGDIAAQCADITDLGIGDHQRGLLQDRQMKGDVRGIDEIVLRGHRADDERIAVAADALELADAAKIDQMLGRCEAQLHHRDEAMTTGERPGFLAELGQ
ncbi:hypothetical protein D3C72_1805110 [compost metagenome]